MAPVNDGPSASRSAIQPKHRGAKGIKDFGDGEGFSPIDLVMRARGCSLDRRRWHGSMSACRPDDGTVQVDFDAIGAKAEEPNEEPKGEGPRKKGRFTFTPSWMLQPDTDETAYLVDELIPMRGIVLLWGPPKCLKSFFTLDLMWHVGNGWEYRERSVHQGAVIYCAFEGKHGYKRRVPALRVHYEQDRQTDRMPVDIMSGKTDLVRDHATLVQEIREEAKRELGVDRPVAVVLDTLNKSLVGSESKDLDMAAYIRAAEAVRDAFDCVVIVVHHCGWDECRMRGHSSLRGAVDAELSVTRSDDVVVVTVEEMRDGPDGVQIVSKSRIVEVGTDSRGRPLTSLVIVPHEMIAGETPGKPHQWPPSLKVFHAALLEALLTAGVDHQIFQGPKVKAVDLEKLRFVFYTKAVVSSADDTSAESRQRARRAAFKRAVDQANAKHLIAACVLEDGTQLVWLAKEEERNGTVP